ncbi:MAG TPA: hypothetical protein VKR82_00840 [Candidatus Acidoferrales bacterium]|nr:hypothetical protein [Candidatus Acidoferrales bacterium]
MDNKSSKPVPSAGKIFADGVAMELIRNSSGTLGFLTWDGHAPKIVDQFTHRKLTYVTPQIHSSVCDSLVLPTGMAEFGSTRQLFNQISKSISRASGGKQSIVVPLSFFIFSTWLVEYGPVPSFLWIVVPPTFNTVALKQILRLLCRHAVVVNLLSASWPTSLPMGLQPTLIAEVDSPSRRLLNTLCASQQHGSHPTRAGQVVDPFCAKAIFAREPLEGPAAAGFPLEIVLAPADEYVPPLDSSQAARIAEEFQNKLLAYRVKNFSKTAPPSFDLGRVSSPVQALAHSLAGPIVGDCELQSQILPFLWQQDADIQTDSVTSLETMILQVLVARRNDVEFGDTELAAYVNSMIRGRGGSREISPETAGWRLKALGLHTTTISGGLRGLRMVDVRQKIAKLAAAYGVSVPEQISKRGDARGSPPVPRLA